MTTAINPDSIDMESTGDPLVFTMSCDAITDDGTTHHVVARVNIHMTPEAVLRVVDAKIAAEIPVTNADALVQKLVSAVSAGYEAKQSAIAASIETTASLTASPVINGG
jgi:hypothetical protein